MGKKKKGIQVAYGVKVADDAPRIGVQLTDTIKISNKRKKNGNGFLLCSDALLAKQGILIYNDWELPSSLLEALDYPRKVRVYRSLDTLTEQLDDFDGMPITDGHPFDDVTVKDKAPIVGTVSGPHVNGIGIRSALTVFDAGAIHDIESNTKRELSLGYLANLVIQSGTYDGEQYDVVQTAIVPNHVAITAAGRCGPECAISDHETAAGCGCAACTNRSVNAGQHSHSDKGNKRMELEHVSIGDEVVSVDPKHAPVLKKAAADLKEAHRTIDQRDGELSTVKAELQQLKDENTDEKVQQRINDAARVRGSIVAKTGNYVEKIDDSKTNRELMLAALKVHDSEKDYADRSDDYVQAAFDALPDTKKGKDDDKGRGNGERFASGTTDSKDTRDPMEVAKAQLLERNKSRGRTADA